MPFSFYFVNILLFSVEMFTKIKGPLPTIGSSILNLLQGHQPQYYLNWNGSNCRVLMEIKCEKTILKNQFIFNNFSFIDLNFVKWQMSWWGLSGTKRRVGSPIIREDHGVVTSKQTYSYIYIYTQGRLLLVIHYCSSKHSLS
jgi:hypothetical protein